METQKPHVIVIVGPTSSGKSDYAIQLAKTCNGEIISADSRQIYKELDLGTGKVTKEEMEGIPHHMLSVYNLTEDVGVARYAFETLPIIHDILSRNKTPIICGGTGQYIDALIYNNTFPQVEPDKNLRDELEIKSTEELYQLLTEKDPRRAGHIDKHNRVRLIRALEIIAKLGIVPEEQEKELRFNVTLYLMDISREYLKEKIITRVDRRFALGMLAEGKAIYDKGYHGKILKKFGLEYVVMGNYFDGELTFSEMRDLLISQSYKYAKRQQTWNKKYLPFAILVPVVKK
jgi:tRNA dimethylallyltransferase